MLVVVPAPGSDRDTGLKQARKPMVIQALAPEALDERVLHGGLPRTAGNGGVLPRPRRDQFSPRVELRRSGRFRWILTGENYFPL